MDTYEIYHNDWNDYIKIITKKKILFRLSNINEIGNYIINDNFLIIDWNNWNKEYFYKKNNI